MKFYTLLTSFILFVMIFMAGCSSRHIQPKNSGFFQNYKDLVTAKKIDIYKYNEVIVSPVIVISAIPVEKQTESQKKLYKEISEYVTEEYKKIFNSTSMYKLVEKESGHTLKLESAISAVEVHFDDEKWDNNTPIALGVDVVSFNSYVDESVRILGESRFVDAWSGEVLGRTIDIQKDNIISLKGDNLEFSDVKEALDSWLEAFKKDLNN